AAYWAGALRDLEGVAVDHPGPRSGGGDVHARAGAELGQALEPLHGVRLLVVRHQAEVPLEVFLPVQRRLLACLRGRDRVARGLEEAEPGAKPRRDAADPGPPTHLALQELPQTASFPLLAPSHP